MLWLTSLSTTAGGTAERTVCLICSIPPSNLEVRITHVLLGVFGHFKVPGHSTQLNLFPGSIQKVIRRHLRIK